MNANVEKASRLMELLMPSLRMSQPSVQGRQALEFINKVLRETATLNREEVEGAPSEWF